MKRQVFGKEISLQAAAFTLRYQVFVLEQNIPAHLEFDEIDAKSPPYFVIFDDCLPIATIRYQADEKQPDLIRPDRFCVAKEYRRKGIGRQLLTDYERQGKKDGYKGSILSAEWSAKAFYEKLGYQAFGKTFLEDGIKCVNMQKDF